MKKFYILMFALLIANGTMAQWVQQNSGTMHNLYSVCFTDPSTGYIVGDSGTILKTTDGGNQWTLLNSGTTKHLRSVKFSSSSMGYAVGENGTILKTSNGGTLWTIQPLITSEWLTSVCFPQPDTGYVVGMNDTIMKTVDGSNWIILDAGTLEELHLLSVFFTDANTGYAAGFIWGAPPLKIIVKTENGGITWTIVHQSFSADYGSSIRSVYFTDANTGYAVGVSEGYGCILKATDGGATWIYQTSGTTETLSSVFFTDAERGYVVGSSGVIFRTIDGGINWIGQTSGTTNGLTSACFTDEDTGYVVGEGGTILKTTNGGLTGLNEYGISSKFLKIYPNPAKDIITIESLVIEDIYLSILNMNGQKIVERPITEHKTQIDISKFPHGVYFIKLRNCNTVEVKKIIKE